MIASGGIWQKKTERWRWSFERTAKEGQETKESVRISEQAASDEICAERQGRCAKNQTTRVARVVNCATAMFTLEWICCAGRDRMHTPNMGYAE